MNALIKVGFCVAYDWEMLRKSLPLIYDHADQICLSLDINRKSWSGKFYLFDDLAFHAFLKKTDTQKKIDLYEDDFFVRSLSPIENDNRQRKLMSDRMGAGGWHIQIDSDEYFLNFKGFVNFLKSKTHYLNGKPVNICCPWVSIYKRVSDGYLIVDNAETTWETMPFATNKPEYFNARRNSHFNAISTFFVVHETWSRSSEELKQKLNSWGHNDDFLSKESYLKFWEAIDKFNYQFVDDFHPLQSGVWKKLMYVKANSIDELLSIIKTDYLFKINKASLYLKNSRNWNRLLSLWQKRF